MVVKNTSLCSLALTLMVAGVFWYSEALGYEEVDVRNGGSIAGKVRLNGPIPDPRVFPLVLCPCGPFCKKISDGKGHIVLEEFIVGTGGALQDAVVAVQQVERGKAFPVIKNEFVVEYCMFHP